MSKFTQEALAAVRNAATAVRGSLVAAPIFMAAVAGAAGMAPTDAKAWGSEYENLGRVIGGELGREAAGTPFGAKGRIGQLVGEVVGRSVAAPFDASAKESAETARLEKLARERAIQDSAYEAQRKKLDPTYSGTAASSDRSNQTYGAVSSNMDKLLERQRSLAERFQVRQR